MVVCTMQSYGAEQQLNGCKSPQTAQLTETGIINKENENEIETGKENGNETGNGAEEEDREEGEIVDEFEMIISSEDEEFKLRARIQQLEDKSKDIEKMEMLSANLANQYNYQRPPKIERYAPKYQHFSPISVLSDVSSLSEDDKEQKFEEAKKYKRHKMKRSESKRHSHLLRRNGFSHRTHLPQQQQLKKKRRHDYHNNHYHQKQAILVDSLDSVTDDEIGEYDMNVENENDEYEELELSRKKLRVALARAGNNDIKPKHSLKERLHRLRKSPSPVKRDSELTLITDRPRSDLEEEHAKKHRERERERDQESDPPVEEPPELKLRLIALKSAILKKHMARKKRDAERAYSPTDMINRVHQPTVSNELNDDIDDLMEISPAASPERTADSPPPPAPPRQTHLVEPVDMELAQTDSEEDRHHWPANWQPTMNAGGSWRCFLPHASLPPVSMPIVIDEQEPEQPKEQQLQDEDDEVPPPPPSYHIPHMQVEDDDARDALHLSEQHSQNGSLTDIQSVSMDNSQTQTQNSRPFQAESSDDAEAEAIALRAMLLAKLKPAAKGTEPQSVRDTGSVEAVDSDDPEALRLHLLATIASKQKQNGNEKDTADSPEILKKAVQRFQASTIQDANVIPAENVLEEIEDKLPSPEPLAVSDTAFVILPEPVPAPLPVPAHAGEASPTSASSPVPIPAQALPSASASIIKIIKPNKIINKKTALKRKILKVPEAVPPIKRPSTLLVKETVAPLYGSNSGSSTRLITTLDPSTIKVNKLVIALAESSAGSDDELEMSTAYAYTSYPDNASPFSQVMDSASNSTTRSNTPISEILDSSTATNPKLRRTVINEYFEKKLDDFLKQARSKVSTISPLASSTSPTDQEKSTELPTKAVEQTAVVPPKAKQTPVAVRHLPVASQKEYLRLVERMKLLEKKKIGAVKAANGQAAVVTKSTKEVVATTKIVAATATPTATAVKATTVPLKITNTANISSKKAETVKKVELPSTSDATKATQESRLKAFENSFHKIGGSMITNLERSLHMVEDAKKSKIARLRYARRLEDLFAEMQTIKQAVKLEETRLARLQPDIQASHEIIISLKQKRNKLRKAAMDLGNGLQGADYRLMDPGKAEIMRKSTQLTKEIRLYNSLVKYANITQLEAQAVTKPKPVPEAAAKPNPVVTPPTEPETEPIPSAPSNQSQSDDQQKQQAEPPQRDAEPRLDVDIPPEDRPPPSYKASFMRPLFEAPPSDSLLGEYYTPISRNYNRTLNVQAILCPFELMGRCEDAECIYLHLPRLPKPGDSVKVTATAATAKS